MSRGTSSGSSEPEPEIVAGALAGFARERQWLLPALHAVQHGLGWLPEWALADVAAHLRVPASEVLGVATHYPELRLAPRGRHHLRVCTGVSCLVSGGRALVQDVALRHGDTPPESGADREVTREAADCFFACSMAPLVEVDGAYHGRVTPADLAGVARWFREGAGTGPARDAQHADDAAGAHARGAAAETPPAQRARREWPAESAGRLGGAATARAALDILVEGAQGRQRSRLRLLVQAGTCGRAVGAAEVLRALRDAASARGLDADVVEGACNGMCYAAPLITLEGGGVPRAAVERVTPVTVPALVEALASGADLARAGFGGVTWAERSWRGLPPVATHPFWAGQERLLLGRAGAIDPASLADALAAGAYASLARALDGSPEAVIATVKASGLQGRGGAFFPAALKWEACRKAAGEPKYLVLNGEEGEPGIFKDRHLMEGDPHQVLEGVLIAAYAAGATRVILYVHGEADLAAARLAGAVAAARAAGIVGDRVLGRGVACHVELRRGAGGFVLGEETALLESIEGRRAQPRTRPPFPVESGLWGKPTVINNVETLSAVPHVVGGGPERFAALGTAKAPGTKVFGLSGPIARPGVVETRNGVTLRALLDVIGGGLTGGRRVLGALVGGPSGSIVPAALFDEPMEPRGRVSPGTGGIVALPEDASVLEVVKTLVGFNARESCGKCTPCREGLPRLLEMLDELATTPGVEPRLLELAETIQLASLCGLGQAAPIAVLRGLETHGDAFRRSAR